MNTSLFLFSPRPNCLVSQNTTSNFSLFIRVSLCKTASPLPKKKRNQPTNQTVKQTKKVMYTGEWAICIWTSRSPEPPVMRTVTLHIFAGLRSSDDVCLPREGGVT